MEQFGRHCFIKIHQQETQPLLVPFVNNYYTSEKNKQWYITTQMDKQQAVSREEIDGLLENQERALINMVAPPPQTDSPAQPPIKRRSSKSRKNIFETVDLDS
jgi:hypothetical protein